MAHHKHAVLEPAMLNSKCLLLICLVPALHSIFLHAGDASLAVPDIDAAVTSRGVSSFSSKLLTNGLVFEAAGAALGKFEIRGDRSIGYEDERIANQASLRQFLNHNEVFLGNTEALDIRIKTVGSMDESVAKAAGYMRANVNFEQVLPGIVSSPSTLIVVDGQVAFMSVYLVQPDSPTFQKANWLSEKQLNVIARSAVASVVDVPDLGQSSEPNYLALFSEDQEAFIVVYEVVYGTKMIRIDVSSGAVISLDDTIST